VDLRLALFDDAAVADTAVADTARTRAVEATPAAHSRHLICTNRAADAERDHTCHEPPRIITAGRPSRATTVCGPPVDGQTMSGGVPTRWNVSRIFLGRRPHALTGLSV
jgi:hypothetical protein